MKKFIVIANGSVMNIIVADSKETAEQVTGFECVEINENDEIKIGDDFLNKSK
jgi:hypothetical protein